MTVFTQRGEVSCVFLCLKLWNGSFRQNFKMYLVRLGHYIVSLVKSCKSVYAVFELVDI